MNVFNARTEKNHDDTELTCEVDRIRAERRRTKNISAVEYSCVTAWTLPLNWGALDSEIPEPSAYDHLIDQGKSLHV